MASNRFKGQKRAAVKQKFAGVARVIGIVWRAIRPVTLTVLAFGILGGLGYAAWNAVLQSPYFTVRTVQVQGSTHLTRDAVIARAGLAQRRNMFRFDPQLAIASIEGHPWVARAAVETALPSTVIIEFEERRPEGVVVLGGLYLVDGTGEPFVKPSPAEAAGLPLITGLNRETYQADPETAHARIREALAIARHYARTPLAAHRPLSNVHLGEGGRLELFIGRTRVVLGQTEHRAKLRAAQRVFSQLKKRKLDASYILLSEDEKRAIVKEIPLVGESDDSLTMRRAARRAVGDGAVGDRREGER
ncbi:MAG: cell division protein FtsQ [Bradymonadia bacterium]|jgi:cell division protein FtsQ